MGKICNALKTAAITYDKHFSMGECMDEFACSYSTAFQMIEGDPSYNIKRHIVEGMACRATSSVRKVQQNQSKPSGTLSIIGIQAIKGRGQLGIGLYYITLAHSVQLLKS